MASCESQIVVTATRRQKRGWIWGPIILTSAAAHLALLLGSGELVDSQPKRYGASRVTVQVVRPAERAETKQPSPKVRPKAKRAPQKRRATRSRRMPKPNTAHRAVARQPARPVFGVTASSLTSDSEVAVRQGNTLDKQMELKPVTPKWVTSKLPTASPSAPKAKPSRPFAVGRLTRRPAFSNKVEPVYPDAVRQRGTAGTVLLRVVIDQRGRICRVTVVRSPDAALATAAIAALRRSTLTPGYIGRRPVRVVLKIPYRFVLEG